MGNFIISILNWLIQALGAILGVILSILPPSPFQIFNNSVFAQFLPYINYFIPFNEILIVLQTWILCVGAYYIYQVGLRWVKAIE